MKIYYKLEELPEEYQTQFREGFNLKNLSRFYPAVNGYGSTLFTLIALGLPAILVIILAIWALFQPMANPPKNTKEWLIFIGIALFVLLILAGIVNWVYNLFRSFRLEAKIRKIRKEQGVSHYGLLLSKHLVHRPLSIKNKILMLPREAVRRVEAKSKRVEGHNRQYFHLIYYDEGHDQEYYIEMGKYELDKAYTRGNDLSRIIKNWR